jgi:hypothetical protein
MYLLIFHFVILVKKLAANSQSKRFAIHLYLLFLDYEKDLSYEKVNRIGGVITYIVSINR